MVIHNYDVKDLKSIRFDVIASRAFKPMLTFLNILEESAINFRKILLLKGENYQLEMNEAKKYWEINCDMHESVTNPTNNLANYYSNYSI